MRKRIVAELIVWGGVIQAVPIYVLCRHHKPVRKSATR
jgi:hypothetical protein